MFLFFLNKPYTKSIKKRGEGVEKEKLLSIREEIKKSNTLYNTMLEILFLNLDKNSEKIKNLDNLEEKLKSCQDSIYRTIEEIEKIILIIQD